MVLLSRSVDSLSGCGRMVDAPKQQVRRIKSISSKNPMIGMLSPTVPLAAQFIARCLISSPALSGMPGDEIGSTAGRRCRVVTPGTGAGKGDTAGYHPLVGQLGGQRRFVAPLLPAPPCRH